MKTSPSNRFWIISSPLPAEVTPGSKRTGSPSGRRTTCSAASSPDWARMFAARSLLEATAATECWNVMNPARPAPRAVPYFSTARREIWPARDAAASIFAAMSASASKCDILCSFLMVSAGRGYTRILRRVCHACHRPYCVPDEVTAHRLLRPVRKSSAGILTSDDQGRGWQRHVSCIDGGRWLLIYRDADADGHSGLPVAS